MTATTEPERSRHYGQIPTGWWPDWELMIRAVEDPESLTPAEVADFTGDCAIVGIPVLPGHFENQPGDYAPVA